MASKARDLSRRGHRATATAMTEDSITAAHVGLGNVTNESKATMFADPTFTGTVNCTTLSAQETLRNRGHQVWTTEGATTPYIPYNGGYYTTLFWNTGNYHSLNGRLYVAVAISQAHQGIYDFSLNAYGSGIANRSTGAHNSYIGLSGTTTNGYPALRLTNTNGSSWGNGWYYMTAIVWGGADDRFVSSAPGVDDNFSSSQSGNFFTRVV